MFQLQIAPVELQHAGSMKAGWRLTALVVGLVVLALSLVAAQTSRLMTQERAALFGQFALDQERGVREVAIAISQDLRDAEDDLRFTARLLDTAAPADGQRALTTLLGAVNEYRIAEIYDVHGERLFTVNDPRSFLDPQPYAQAMRTTALAALTSGNNSLQVSPPLTGAEAGWHRAFAVPIPSARSGAGALVVLVDTEPLFKRTRPLTAATGSRLLILGREGQALPGSDPQLAAQLGPGIGTPSWHGLLDQMSRGEHGGIRISGAEAQALGIGTDDFIATFAPIGGIGGKGWSIARLASTQALGQHEQRIAFRIGMAATAIALCLITAGAYFVVASRRALLLRERLRHAERVAELTTRLLHAEKLATVGILAAGIAHEIGTPLGVIRGRAEYLAEKLDGGNETRDATIIVDQADLVTRIIRQLLDFSRPKPTEVRPVSIESVVSTVVELLRIEAERRKVVVAAEIPPGLPAVAADRDQLQQVLVNLLMNACDASQAGAEVKLSAAVEATVDGPSTVRIEVIDHGAGIPGHHRHQVFDPFFTTKKRGQGTGLGLTIAAQIVRDHKGRIELESEPRRGTRVVVHWPTANAAQRVEEAHGLIG